MTTQATDFDQYLITCEREDCKMQFFYLPEHEAQNWPRLCGTHVEEHMRYEKGLQGHPHWSVD